MERKGIERFETLYNTKVKKCGLFISRQYPFLGASPDGIAILDSQEVLFECKWVAQKKMLGIKASGLHSEHSALLSRKN